jgi:hypothetical protein
VYGVFELICVDDFSARDMTEPSKTWIILFLRRIE